MEDRIKKAEDGRLKAEGENSPRSEYSHGGNIYKVSEESGIPEYRYIDFSASINPLGVSRRVKQTVLDELDGLANYPDPDTRLLREKLALFNDISPESIICSNGSTELIYLIPRVLKPEGVLITAPTFSEYERACKLSCQSSVIRYQLKEKENFRINPDDFIGAMAGMLNREPSTVNCQQNSMAFICNPNNPAGTVLTREEVLRIADAAREKNCFLVVDEAFIDFCPSESVICDVSVNPYLIVLRSMTKFYALPGLRVGYGIFHESLTDRIKEFKEPWSVNHLAQRAAATAIEDMNYAMESFELIKKEKEYLEKSLSEIGIYYLPSAANYYLLKIPSEQIDSGELVRALRKSRLIVRDCSNFEGLDSSYIRIAVKSHEDNEILINKLSRLIKTG